MSPHGPGEARPGAWPRAAALAFALAVALASAAAACRPRVEAKDCEAMLDKYIEMVVAADPSTRNLPDGQAALVRESKKAAKKAEASYARVQSQCMSEVTRKEYVCAMAAKNPEEWEACIE